MGWHADDEPEMGNVIGSLSLGASRKFRIRHNVTRETKTFLVGHGTSRQPKVAGLIIESGIADPAERFLTYADLKSAGIEEADVHAEVQRYFDHKQKLSGYTNPLLILHTEDDGLIDISHAERNHEWAGSTQKQLVRFPNGNHNTILRANLTEYLATVNDFVESVQS